MLRSLIEKTSRTAGYARLAGITVVVISLGGHAPAAVKPAAARIAEISGWLPAAPAPGGSVELVVRATTGTCPAPAIAERIGDTEEVYRALVLGLRDYVAKNRFPSVMLGLSGGIDSALVAAISYLVVAAIRG